MRSRYAVRHFVFNKKSLLIGMFLFFSAANVWSANEQIESLDFANGLFARKMFKLAIAEYEKAVAKSPETKEAASATFMIAESSFLMKEYDRAYEKYAYYINTFPKGTEVLKAYLRMIACENEKKEYAKAIEDAGALLKRDISPEIRSEALYLSGIAKLDNGDTSGATADMQSAMDITPPSPATALAAYQLGYIRAKNGDNTGASELFNKSAALADDPDLKLDAMLAAGQAKLEGRRYDEAIEDFKNVIFHEKVEPDDRGRAFLGLFQAYYDARRFKDIVDMYTRWRDLFSKGSLRFPSSVIVAQAYGRLSLYDDAIALLDASAKDDTFTADERDSAALEKLAMLITAKRFKDASALISARTEYNDVPRYLYLKAEADFYSGDLDKAREGYEELLAKFPSSPMAAEALYGVGHVALEKKDRKKARDIFVELAKKYPDSRPAEEGLYRAILIDNELGLKEDGAKDALKFIERYPDNENVGTVSIILARFYTDLKMPKDAIKVLEDFAKRYPSSGKMQEVNFLLGYNYQASSDLAMANSYYLKIPKDPAIKGMYYASRKNMIQNYLMDKNEADALRTVDELITTYPDNDFTADTYIWAVKKYIDDKKYSDAVRILDMCAKNPKMAEVRKLDILYFKGEAARGMGDIDAAIKEYEKCVQEDKAAGSFTGASFQGIGLSYLAKDDLDNAKIYFEKAIAFNPEDNTVVMRARHYLADVLYKKGQFEEAARMFMMVAILYDDNRYVPDALWRAGDAFLKAGLKDDASRAFKEYEERFPSGEKAKDAKKAVAELGTKT